MKTLVLMVMLVLVLPAAETHADPDTTSPVDAVSDDSAPEDITDVLSASQEGEDWDQACCRICSKGKACGDTCISKEKTCEESRGCACDGD